MRDVTPNEQEFLDAIHKYETEIREYQKRIEYLETELAKYNINALVDPAKVKNLRAGPMSENDEAFTEYDIDSDYTSYIK